MLEESGLSIMRAGASLVIVLCLMALLALIMRRLQGGERPWDGLLPTPNTPKKRKRLSIVETKMIDSRTKIVLFTQDDQEFLITVGQDGVTLINPRQSDAVDSEKISTTSKQHSAKISAL
jgi:flagellar biogenesis protein FliO